MDEASLAVRMNRDWWRRRGLLAARSVGQSRRSVEWTKVVDGTRAGRLAARDASCARPAALVPAASKPPFRLLHRQPMPSDSLRPLCHRSPSTSLHAWLPKRQRVLRRRAIRESAKSGMGFRSLNCASRARVSQVMMVTDAFGRTGVSNPRWLMQFPGVILLCVA